MDTIWLIIQRCTYISFTQNEKQQQQYIHLLRDCLFVWIANAPFRSLHGDGGRGEVWSPFGWSSLGVCCHLLIVYLRRSIFVGLVGCLPCPGSWPWRLRFCLLARLRVWCVCLWVSSRISALLKQIWSDEEKIFLSSSKNVDTDKNKKFLLEKKNLFRQFSLNYPLPQVSYH